MRSAQRRITLADPLGLVLGGLLLLSLVGVLVQWQLALAIAKRRTR